MRVAVALVALAATASLLPVAAARAHPQSTLEPETSAGKSITGLWWFMLTASVIVVAVVTALVLLAMLRREGRAGERLARRLGVRRLIWIAGGALPAIVLAVLFALTLDTLVESSPSHLRPRMEIEVTGRQWFWDVRYPSRAGAITANEIHVPVGVPVAVSVRTKDVLHSFWVPRLNRKVDLVPGRVNRVTFQADRPGVYRGQCAEFCGPQHANMGFFVIAEEHARFDAWLAAQAAPARTPSTPAQERGRAVFMDSGCAACHTIRGTEASATVGPDLTHLASRRTIAAATLPNRHGDLAAWVLAPQDVKPGNRMPALGIPDDDVAPLLDYLGSLR